MIKQEVNVQVPVSVPTAATPHPHDVLFCDGAIVASHPGSKFFCEQVHLLLPQYKGSAVNEKRIEQKIIATIGDRWPPGRFLCATNMNMAINTNYNNWQVLSFNQALQATSAHLHRACFESQRVVIPNHRDVLVVRGNSQHQGNIYFRSLIEKYCKSNESILMASTSASSSMSVSNQNQNNVMTHAAQTNAKKRIAKQIVEEVERVGGRFLKFNNSESYWEPLDLETTLSKALQGMRDYQKKKEVQQKPVKQVGVVIPALKCVKENVTPVAKNNSRIGDPPGVFFNYYSTSRNHENNSLAISANGRDPPGQVPSVIPRKKIKTMPNVSTIKKEPEPHTVLQELKRPDSPSQVKSHIQTYPASNGVTPYMNGVPVVNPNLRIVSDNSPGLQNFFQNQHQATQSIANHSKRKICHDVEDNIGYSNNRPVEKRMKLLEP